MTNSCVHPAFPGEVAVSGTARLLDGGGDLAAHLRHHGPVPWRGGLGKLIGEIADAGLLGRGGAGFPAWRKLAAVAAGSRPVVVANAAEGEPASAKDRTLLAVAPHLVLDGLQLAAEAVGADTAVLYLADEGAAAGARRALAERAVGGWDRLAVRVVCVPAAFLAGEESSVVAGVAGRPAVPADKIRRVSSAGVHGRPTLVQNVETLAHLALIARYGAAWFRRVGTADEPGTALCTVSGAVARPGVDEVPYGTRLSVILERAGGVVEPVQALLVGGYHGTWLPASALSQATLSRAGLAPFGANPGAGVVRALPAAACGIAVSADIVGYLAAQSARQCGPCRAGLPAMAELLCRIATSTGGPDLVAEIHRLTALVSGRGACHHPDGTVRFVRSALETFSAELDRHRAGHCGARRASR